MAATTSARIQFEYVAATTIDRVVRSKLVWCQFEIAILEAKSHILTTYYLAHQTKHPKYRRHTKRIVAPTTARVVCSKLVQQRLEREI